MTPVLTDSHYLEDWASDLDAGTHVPADAPVTRVSWFAASAYCQWKGKELPTVDQWERAAAGGGKDAAATREKILSWYSRPGTEPLRPVGREAPNAYGLHDLHGLIWEWTLDFNSSLVSTENRDSGSKDDPLFCGAGSQGASRSERLRDLHALCAAQQPQGQLHHWDPRLPLCEGDGEAMTWIRIALTLALAVLPRVDTGEGPRTAPHSRCRGVAGRRSAGAPLGSVHLSGAHRVDGHGRKVCAAAFAAREARRPGHGVHELHDRLPPHPVANLKRIESALSPEARGRVWFALFSFDSERDRPGGVEEVRLGP